MASVRDGDFLSSHGPQASFRCQAFGFEVVGRFSLGKADVVTGISIRDAQQNVHVHRIDGNDEDFEMPTL